MSRPMNRPPSLPLEPSSPERPGHAALIRIEEYLFRVRIWTRAEWDALPQEERPPQVAPLARGGWHRTEPADMALWFAPGDLACDELSLRPGGTWPPGSLPRKPLI